MDPIQALETAKMDEAIAVAWLKYKNQLDLNIDPKTERFLFRIFQSGFLLGGLEIVRQARELI